MIPTLVVTEYCSYSKERTVKAELAIKEMHCPDMWGQARVVVVTEDGKRHTLGADTHHLTTTSKYIRWDAPTNLVCFECDC